MESCAPEVAIYDLQYSVPLECVNALRLFLIDFHIYHFYWQQAHKVPVDEVVFQSQYASHLEN